MRVLTLIFLLFTSIASAYAESPDLASEQLFSGKYNKVKGVTISISKKDGMYGRTIIVKQNQNPAIVKTIEDCFNKDKERASSFHQYIDEEGVRSNIEITNNGESIRIGLNQDEEDGEVMLIIRGPEKAFK